MTVVPKPPHPIEILRYYTQSLEALDALKGAVRPLLDVGNVATRSRFFGMTADEFDEALFDLRGELDHQVVLMLTASFEAVFQTDLQERIRRKKKGELSKALRKWWRSARRRRQEWIELGSLLDAWKKTVGHGQVIGRMKSLLLFRHWLAHGRYWVDKSGLRQVDPFTA